MDAPAICKPVCAQNTALIPSVRLGRIPVGEIGAGAMLWLVVLFGPLMFPVSPLLGAWTVSLFCFSGPTITYLGEVASKCTHLDEVS